MASKAIAVRRRRTSYFGRTRTHHKKQFTLPLAVIAGFIPLGVSMYSVQREMGTKAMLTTLPMRLIGYNPNTRTWNLGDMSCGTFAIAAGFAAHMIASKLGLNRVLARSGIPIIRI